MRQGISVAVGYISIYPEAMNIRDVEGVEGKKETSLQLYFNFKN